MDAENQSGYGTLRLNRKAKFVCEKMKSLGSSEERQLGAPRGRKLTFQLVGATSPDPDDSTSFVELRFASKECFFCYSHRILFVRLHMSSCPSLPVVRPVTLQEIELD
ncbi:hypothetical protein EYF80_041454 [Liparis tanakae]|uniref:Uncharacterized protein n=1 Tax=Liparis tanakae TaxID=230148 RepID=A0A4Z2G443_9TELE|nr:hypothetical protein EYF80_041454 [Liparis tanakae]